MVRLRRVFTAAELEDAAEVDAVQHDVRTEAVKYGALEGVDVVRSADGAEPPEGLGDVLLSFCDAQGAARAATALQGRLFGDAPLEAELVAAQ